MSEQQLIDAGHVFLIIAAMTFVGYAGWQALRSAHVGDRFGVKMFFALGAMAFTIALIAGWLVTS